MLTDIYKAFADKLYTRYPNMPTAFVGVHFEPPSTGQWFEVRAFWNENFELGANAPTVEQGFFRVFVSGRTSESFIDLQDLAGEVVDLFPKNVCIGDAFVERTPSTSGPFVDGDKIQIPVTVRWRAIR